MKLYSIRNTQTGLFFLSHDWRGKLHWSTAPIFWKTPDGVVRTLRRLGSEFDPKHSHYRPARQENWENFRASRLKHIEVIVTDVSIHGEEALPAASFFNKQKLRELAPPIPTGSGG